MTNQISTIINRLANEPASEAVYNPYHVSHGPPAEICRGNLSHYWTSFQGEKGVILMVGEALGHRGGRLTGIPFTSERILLENRLSNMIDFSACRVANVEKPASEQTATIVWNGFAQLKQLPLCWNAFPFHPFKKGKPLSNRPPTTAELGIGSNYLRLILSTFDIGEILAVGRRAELALGRMGIKHTPIRHPSHGGKIPFLDGLDRVVNLGRDAHN